MQGLKGVIGRMFDLVPKEALNETAARANLEGTEKLTQAREQGALEALSILMTQQQRAAAPWPFFSSSSGPRDAYLLAEPQRYSQFQNISFKPGTFANPQTLRTIADTYDPARSCISHLKREAAAVAWKIVPIEEDDASAPTQRAIKEAEKFFSLDGGFGGPLLAPRHVFDQMIEDVLATGAYSMFCEFRGGYLSRVMSIDSLTIKPRIDAHGWPDEQEPYEQWIHGAKVRGFSKAELLYDGLDPCSWHPYFRSPIEYLMAVILTAMAADSWNRDWLTDGTTPGELLTMPQDWTPDQIRDFFNWFTAIAQGSKARRQLRMAPSGSKVAEFSRRDQEFGQMEEQLIRRTCSVFGVSPASISYEGSTYKVSQDSAKSQTSEIGVRRILDIRKDMIDQLLVRLGFPFLHCSNISEREEAAKDKTERIVKATGSPYMTVNEGRKEAGLDPVPGGDTIKTQAASPSPPSGDQEPVEEEVRAELGRWLSKSLKSLKRGLGASVSFDSAIIDSALRARVNSALMTASTPEAIRAAFSHETN